jgi:hypothetical protein
LLTVALSIITLSPEPSKIGIMVVSSIWYSYIHWIIS